LEEAIAAFREALKERTRERVPLEWATTQSNLGLALSALGLMRGSEPLLEEAIAAYRDALKEWTRERVPLEWAMTQNNLGLALWSLGQMRGDETLLEEAIAAFRGALEVFERHHHAYAEAVRRNLAGAEQALAETRAKPPTGAMAFIRRLVMRPSRKVPKSRTGEMLPPLGERVRWPLAAHDPAERLHLAREQHERIGRTKR
jgi:tetratricopeptide (TPR) repeat protein